ncbi:MAG: TolB family protein [Gemmatimonadaceae bacterium]
MIPPVIRRAACLAALPVSALLAQRAPSTDIWMATLDGRGVPHVGRAENLTHRPGYDNQPSFTPDGSAILYTVVEGTGPSDIWRIDLGSRARSRVTTSGVESEYSATPMPDGLHFSSVRVEADSTQRLWKFAMAGQEAPSVLLPDIKPVGYHVWASDVTLGLFVLGSPATLQIADVRTGTAEVAARNIGRALQKIPGRNAISFQQLRADGAWITAYDLATGRSTPIAKCPDRADYHIWTPEGVLLTASGSKVLAWVNGKWDVAADLAADGVHDITRLAISAKGDRLAFVAEDTSR